MKAGKAKHHWGATLIGIILFWVGFSLGGWIFQFVSWIGSLLYPLPPISEIVLTVISNAVAVTVGVSMYHSLEDDTFTIGQVINTSIASVLALILTIVQFVCHNKAVVIIGACVWTVTTIGCAVWATLGLKGQQKEPE